MNYTNSYDIPRISDTSKEICDADITLQEIEDSVKGLANNKAPGPDGLPGEFYQMFWNDISKLVTKTFQDAFLKRSIMPVSGTRCNLFDTKTGQELN